MERLRKVNKQVKALSRVKVRNLARVNLVKVNLVKVNLGKAHSKSKVLSASPQVKAKDKVRTAPHKEAALRRQPLLS